MFTRIHSHPDIGAFTASAQADTLQFLGVQYATLGDRFAPPVLKQYDAESTVDATGHGPQVNLGGADFEFKLLQHSLPHYNANRTSTSETACLNLNITVPVKGRGEPVADRLPVFVFIHGGGFMNGSANFPQYDLIRLVRLSVKQGTPMIGVSVNYRLGITGFLTSNTIQDAGYKANNGLRDQRTALLWLRQYIHAFNGDPENITVVGESAGAVSVAYHLHSEEPLFKRAMLMSGTTLLMGPVPAAATEATYSRAVQALDLGELSDAEVVARLCNMDGQELRGTLMKAGVFAAPSVDGDIAPSEVTWTNVMDGSLPLKGREWCEAVVIGDCAFDGSINSLRLGHRKSGIAKSFHDSMSKSLPEHISAKLFNAYELPASDDEAFVKILEVSNDLQFYAPTVAFANLLSRSSEVYVYRFNEPNTWPGTFQGRTTHIHDLVFLLQNFNEKLSTEQKDLAVEFACDVIRFVNGMEPWKPYQGEERLAKVLKAGNVKVVKDEPALTERRSIVFEIAEEIGWDVYAQVFSKWFNGA
ncbi:hypothetical protein B0A48_10727 [Cryoendolithus antarcticus]|uniref:Carboxylesterase type B domain-containing protein n=1 Tax=Cryoendolithus antarcticus TaxID=1507870 RepID=A0A1V8SYR7_9PEZI|nr:hypothetical protein B0A48_10727 [Cryoendolithus antarcticus]